MLPVAKRPAKFLREHNPARKVRATFRNAVDMLITASNNAFRERSEFTGQLSKSGGNSDIIDLLSKEVGTNLMLRERLLKRIAEELPINKNFEAWCDFLRDDMDSKGKRNESYDQVAESILSGRRTQHRARGRGLVASQGFLAAAVTPYLKKEEIFVIDAIKSSHLLEVDEDAKGLRQRGRKASPALSISLRMLGMDAAQVEASEQMIFWVKPRTRRSW